MLDIDLLVPEVPDRCFTARIPSDAPDESDSRAEPGAGHGLIRALASKCLQEFLRFDCLSSLGQPRPFHGVIGIRAPNHNHIKFRVPLHKFAEPKAKSSSRIERERLKSARDSTSSGYTSQHRACFRGGGSPFAGPFTSPMALGNCRMAR